MPIWAVILFVVSYLVFAFSAGAIIYSVICFYFSKNPFVKQNMLDLGLVSVLVTAASLVAISFLSRVF